MTNNVATKTNKESVLKTQQKLSTVLLACGISFFILPAVYRNCFLLLSVVPSGYRWLDVCGAGHPATPQPCEAQAHVCITSFLQIFLFLFSLLCAPLHLYGWPLHHLQPLHRPGACLCPLIVFAFSPSVLSSLNPKPFRPATPSLATSARLRRKWGEWGKRQGP